MIFKKYKKMNNNKILQILSIFFIILMSSSCKKEDDIQNYVQETSSIVNYDFEVQAVAQENKTINIAMRRPSTLNPLSNSDKSVAKVLNLIFENLMEIDQHQKPISNLVEKISFDSTYNECELKLKNNLKWHDGTQISSSDIIFSYDTIKSSPNSLYKDALSNISSYSILDDLTVKISYTKPYIGYSYFFNFPIIPKHYYTQFSTEIDMKPLGNGAYKFEHFINSREIMLKKNENYFKNKALIEKIKILITKDMESDMYAFDQGIIDVVESDIINWGKYRGDKKTNIVEFLTSEYEFVGFNHNKDLLKDLNIRQAIAHALPIEQILNSVYLGYARSAKTPINPSSWIYKDEVVFYDYDLEMSQSLLQHAGFYKNDEGNFVISKNQIEIQPIFKILVNNENQQRVKIADILKNNLEAISIKSEIISVDFDEYQKKISNKDYDILIGGCNLSLVPDLEFLLYSGNIFGYKNSNIDNLISIANKSTDEETIKDIYSNLQLSISEDLPIISLVFKETALLLDEKIYGEIAPKKWNIFFNINEWFVFEK